MNKKILIVEDEQGYLDILTKKLELAYFDVIQAKNGKDGLEKIIQTQPDLIVLDHVMPIMDGMTMLKQLRDSGDYGKSVKVIFCTNLDANDKLIKDILETNPTFYLLKANYTIDDIVNKVNEVFSAKS